jgi:hypothetical protein
MQLLDALAVKLSKLNPQRAISELKFVPNVILSLPANRNLLMLADV